MDNKIIIALKRFVVKILSFLRKTRGTVFITKHGKPSACLVDADDFEMMQERIQILDDIARAEREISHNRGYSHLEAKLKMKKWLS